MKKPKRKSFIGQRGTEGRVNSSEGNKDQQRRTSRYKLLPVSTNIYIVTILCGRLLSLPMCVDGSHPSKDREIRGVEEADNLTVQQGASP